MGEITKEEVVKFIENMTVLELSGFVKELEGKFGVSAAPGMAVGMTVYGDNYEILLKKGVKLTQPYIDLLKKGGF